MIKTLWISDTYSVEVSDDGRIYRKGKLLSQSTYPKTGYKYISVNKSTYLVHRLVASAFIQPLTRGDRSLQVHHINEDKNDNRVENLIVMSVKDHQHLHKQIYDEKKICVVCGKEYVPSRTKRKISQTCSKECWHKLTFIRAEKRKKPICQYSLDGHMIKIWDSARDIKNKLGFFESNIVKCCKGNIHTYKGYVWKYFEGKENFYKQGGLVQMNKE